MAARARGRVVEVNNRGAKFALDDGKVAVDIVHRPRAQWIFEAGPFRVNVHGTSFTVAWNPVEAVFEVRLASGAISVASPVAGPEIQMRAGQTLRVSLRDQSSTLGTMSDEQPESAIGRRSSDPSEPPPAALRAVRVAALVAPRLDDHALGEQGGRRRRRRGAPGSARRCSSAPTARTCGRSPMPPDMQAGTRWRAQALSAHRRRFPSSDRAREAAFLLGRLHDGDPRRSRGRARMVRSLSRRSARWRGRLRCSRSEDDAPPAMESTHRSSGRRARLLAKVSARHVRECRAGTGSIIDSGAVNPP